MRCNEARATLESDNGHIACEKLYCAVQRLYFYRWWSGLVMYRERVFYVVLACCVSTTRVALALVPVGGWRELRVEPGEVLVALLRLGPLPLVLVSA